MVLIKNIMLLIVFLAVSGIGKVISDKYRKRVIDLKELKIALNMFETKIKFTYEPIPNIFNQIAENINPNVGILFKNAANKMKKKSAGEAWKESLEEFESAINEEDKQILMGLNKLLGKTNLEGQISEIQLTSNFLNHQIEKAEKEEAKNRKMYKTLGVTIGLAIVIILV